MTSILTTGTIGSDNLNLGDENDSIVAGNGADMIAGNDGNDTIFGGGGHDLVLGGDGEDFVRGGRGRDTVFGGRGDDTVTGDAGADWLSGDFGADTLIGGSGDDTFAFNARTATEVDTITDFGNGDDVIELKNFDETLVTTATTLDGDVELYYEGSKFAVLEGAAGTFDESTDLIFI